jgi:serralysin
MAEESTSATGSWTEAPVDVSDHPVGCSCCAQREEDKLNAPSDPAITLDTQPGGDTVAGSTATTATLAIGSSVTGYVNTLGDHDWFGVQLVAGQQYTFTLSSNASSIDSYLRLRDAAGNQLAFNDDGGGGLNSRITFTATSTGTYYLDAGTYQDQTSGAYTLSAQTYTPPPVYSTDQIADFLTVGFWGGPVAHWSTNNLVTFNVQGLTAGAAAIARQAFATWQDVINLTFVETTSAASITLDDTSSGAFASSSSSGGFTTSASINVQQNWSGESNPGRDSYTFQTYIHEIGHTLGLGHGGPYNGSATYGTNNIYQNDTWGYTVMSYFTQSNYDNGSTRYVMTPMVADIVGLQGIYGARTTTRTGDNVYGHNSNSGDLYSFAAYASAPAFTIWDGGGTDTLDASGYSQAQTLNLAAESISSIGGLRNNIFIARNTVVENATGGSGADTITGNSANNVLNGGFGNDTISGGLGSDTLIGGLGVDSMNGGDGADFYYVDNAGDVTGETTVDVATGGFDIVITTANHTLGANIEQLVMEGGATSGTGNATANILYGLNSSTVLTLNGAGGDDVIYGSTAGNNTLIGGEGVDTLLAYGMNNTLQGGLGSDIYYSYAASNTLSEAGGDGIDTVYANHSIVVGEDIEQVIIYGDATSASSSSVDDNNIFFGNSANGAVSLSGGGGADVLFGGAFADTLTGGDGVDLLFGFGGGNTLIGGNDTDIYYVDAAGDQITETSTGGFDTIYSQAAGNTTIAANVEQLILYGAATSATGNGQDNYLFGHIGPTAVTLDGAGGNDYLLGNAASGDVLIGGAGDDQLDLRQGGNDRVRYAAAGSNADTVFGFDADAVGGQDLIDVSGRGFTGGSIGSAITIAASGADTVVTIGADTIRLFGVAVGDVTAADFVF